MMNTQTNQEITENLTELQAIVDLYDPKKNYFGVVIAIAFQIICLTVIQAVGLFWGLLLLGLGLIPIIVYAVEGLKASPSDKELSKRACILMSACVSRYKNPESQIHILQYNSYFGGNNLSLYNEFISIFPQMASKKLKKLASIKLRW